VQPDAPSQAPANARLWRWILVLYLVGIVLDAAWHIRFYLMTGDHVVEGFEWITALQASLFWPLDLLAQAMLALR
jgi:hypothetical protein